MLSPTAGQVRRLVHRPAVSEQSSYIARILIARSGLAPSSCSALIGHEPNDNPHASAIRSTHSSPNGTPVFAKSGNIEDEHVHDPTGRLSPVISPHHFDDSSKCDGLSCCAYLCRLTCDSKRGLHHKVGEEGPKSIAVCSEVVLPTSNRQRKPIPE